MEFEVPATVAPEEHSEVSYDAELDDVRSMLRDVCASLAETPGVRFIATVAEPIQVSVRRDRVVVMEQLRELLDGLRDEEATANLDLYKQGIEAQLLFAAANGRIKIERRDLLGRQAPRAEISLARDVVLSSLRSLARAFIDVARRRSPDRAAHPWFVEWTQSLLAAAAL